MLWVLIYFDVLYSAMLLFKLLAIHICFSFRHKINVQKTIRFLFAFLFGSCFGSVQGLPLSLHLGIIPGVCLGHMGCWGLNMNWLCAKQTFYLLYSCHVSKTVLLPWTHSIGLDNNPVISRDTQSLRLWTPRTVGPSSRILQHLQRCSNLL